MHSIPLLVISVQEERFFGCVDPVLSLNFSQVSQHTRNEPSLSIPSAGNGTLINSTPFRLC